MGKSDEQLKKRQKDTFKSPISPIWLGEISSSELDAVPSCAVD